jgi:hypothetical protein
VVEGHPGLLTIFFRDMTDLRGRHDHGTEITRLLQESGPGILFSTLRTSELAQITGVAARRISWDMLVRPIQRHATLLKQTILGIHQIRERHCSKTIQDSAAVLEEFAAGAEGKVVIFFPSIEHGGAWLKACHPVDHRSTTKPSSRKQDG